jgi:hypothetical protein
MKRNRNSTKCRAICITTHMVKDKQGHYMPCHVCEARIDPVKKPGDWQADHYPIAWANDGPDTAENLWPICRLCFEKKNPEDTSFIAHGKRMGSRHFGVRESKGWRR